MSLSVSWEVWLLAIIIIIAWFIVIEKSTLLSGAREAGHIHCDLVGDNILS